MTETTLQLTLKADTTGFQAGVRSAWSEVEKGSAVGEKAAVGVASAMGKQAAAINTVAKAAKEAAATSAAPKVDAAGVASGVNEAKAELERLGAAGREAAAVVERDAEALRSLSDEARRTAREMQAASVPPGGIGIADAIERDVEALRDFQGEARRAGGRATELAAAQGAAASAAKGGAAALGAHAAASAGAAVATGRHSEALGVNRMAAMETMHSVRASVEMLAAGMPVWRVAEMEGMRYAMVMATVNDGLRGVVMAAAPVAAPVLALGAAMAMVAARAATLAAESRTLGVTLKAIGGPAGLSVDALQGVVDDAGRHGIGRDDALSGIQTLLRAQRFGSTDEIKAVMALAPDFSAAMGVEMPKAVEQLGEAFGHGAAGVLKLDEQLHFLNKEQADALLRMKAVDDAAGAFGVGMAALTGRVGDAAHAMRSELGQALHEVGIAWSELLDHTARNPLTTEIGREVSGGLRNVVQSIDWVLNGESADQKLQNLETRLAQLKAAAAQMEGKPAFARDLASNRAAQAAAEAQRAALAAKAAGVGAGAGGSAGRVANVAGYYPGEEVAIAKATDAFTRETAALQGNAAQRQINIAVLRAELVAEESGASAAAKGDAAKQARTRALRDLGLAAADAVRVTEAEIAGTLRLADAYGVSTAAVREALVQNQAELEIARGTVEARDAIIDRLRRQAQAQRDLAQAQATDEARRQADIYGVAPGLERTVALSWQRATGETAPPASTLAGATPGAMRQIGEVGLRNGVSPALLYGIWGAESDFSKAHDTFRENGAHAMGPFQFIPETAARYGLTDRNDFAASLEAAARYLADLIARAGGNVDKALSDYSGGKAGYPAQVHHQGQGYTYTALRAETGRAAQGQTADEARALQDKARLQELTARAEAQATDVTKARMEAARAALVFDKLVASQAYEQARAFVDALTAGKGWEEALAGANPAVRQLAASQEALDEATRGVDLAKYAADTAQATEADRRRAAVAGQGEAALRREEAAIRVAGEAHGDAARAATLSAAEAAREQAARAKLWAEFLSQSQLAVDQNLKAAAAWDRGAVAAHDAGLQEKAHALALKETTEASADWVATYQKYLEQLRREDQSALVSRLAQENEQQRRSIELQQTELALVGATDEQRAVTLARLKAINDLKAAGVDLSKLEGKALEEANEKVALAVQGARLDTAKQRAQASAQATQQVWTHAAEGIQDALTEAFTAAFDQSTGKSFDFFGALKKLAIRTAAEIASAMVFKPAIGGLLSSVGLGNIAEKLSPGSSGGSGASGGGFSMPSFSGISDLASNAYSGSWLQSVFGGGGAALPIGSGSGTALLAGTGLELGGAALGAGVAGAGAAAGTAAAEAGVLAGTGLEAGGAVAGEAAAMTAELGGTAAAETAGLAGLGLSTGAVTAGIGLAIAAVPMLMSLFSGGGTVDPKTNSWRIGLDQNLYGDAPFVSQLAALVKQNGLSWTSGDGTVPQDRSGDAAAIAELLGRLTGTGTAGQILSNNKFTTIEELQKALAFGKQYDAYASLDTKQYTQTEAAVQKINNEFEQLAGQARQLGLSEDKLAASRDRQIAVLRQQVEDNARLALQQLTDPLGAAWTQLRTQQDLLKRDAEATGADMSLIGSLIGAQNQRLQEQQDLARKVAALDAQLLDAQIAGDAVRQQMAQFDRQALQQLDAARHDGVSDAIALEQKLGELRKKTLQDAINGLLSPLTGYQQEALTGASTLPEPQRLAALQAQLASALPAARTGDATAIQTVAQMADALRQAALQDYGAGPQRDALVSMVDSTVASLIDQLKSSLGGYADGGVSYGPQIAWVSEGAYAAEAHVPLPDGNSIPVTISGPPPMPAPANGGGMGLAPVVDAIEGLGQRVDGLQRVVVTMINGADRRRAKEAEALLGALDDVAGEIDQAKKFMAQR